MPDKKITESEYEIMRLLWDTGRPMTVTEIRLALQETTHWEPTTIKTLIGRLTEKGALVRTKNGVYSYAPAITEREYTNQVTGNVVQHLFRGSAKALVASLIDSQGLTLQDIAQLQEMFHVPEDQK